MQRYNYPTSLVRLANSLIFLKVACHFATVLHKHKLMKEGFKMALFSLECLPSASKDTSLYEITKRLVDMVLDVKSKEKKGKKIQLIVKGFMGCKAQKRWKDTLVLANQINSVGCKEEAFKILNLSMEELTQMPAGTLVTLRIVFF